MVLVDLCMSTQSAPKNNKSASDSQHTDATAMSEVGQVRVWAACGGVADAARQCAARAAIYVDNGGWQPADSGLSNIDVYLNPSTGTYRVVAIDANKPTVRTRRGPLAAPQRLKNQKRKEKSEKKEEKKRKPDFLSVPVRGARARWTRAKRR